MTPRRGLAALAALGLALTAVGCSSDGSDGATEAPATSTTSAGDTATPDGPTATIAGPLEGGDGVFIGANEPAGPQLEAAGYVEEEFTASGTATSYAADDLPADGTWALEPSEEADYATRILVRRPADAADASGVVVVEWLNVSGGVDAGPDWTYLSDELLRQGHTWVGVSAQLIGVEGGPIAVEAPGAAEQGAGTGLVGIDPERYSDLDHPGDAFSYDIYTQVARALREPGVVDPLDGASVDTLLAIGESQSAFALTTYANGVQPLAEAFDGFLIHSRGAGAAPIEAPSGYVEIADSIGGTATTVRTDLDAPVLIVETEGDVLGPLGYLPARQPDTDAVRTWEIAGSAHADLRQIGADREEQFGCAAPVNRGQQVYVLRAALDHLVTWATDGTPPPAAEPLEVDATPAFVRDDVGNVVGGVRTPVVDVPVDVLSGETAPGSSIICLLFGSTEPIPADVLAERYADADDYLARYEAATDALIDAGFLLAADRDEVLADADPSRVGG